jgi:hypothetical protein
MDSRLEDLVARLRALVADAKGGDRSALPAIKGLMDRHPEIADHFGDTARIALEHWMAVYAGHDPVLAEATRRKMLALKVSLVGPLPSAMELLFAEQVLICWLRLNATAALHAVASVGKVHAAVLKERLRQAEAAEQAFDISMRQLAALQRLLPAPVASVTVPTAPTVAAYVPE